MLVSCMKLSAYLNEGYSWKLEGALFMFMVGWSLLTMQHQSLQTSPAQSVFTVKEASFN